MSPAQEQEVARTAPAWWLDPPTEMMVYDDQCCNGNCNQGRSCPVRQACQQPEAEAAKPWWRLNVDEGIAVFALCLLVGLTYYVAEM